MSRLLVIPDVHLKPWIFERAVVRMREEGCDGAVLLGDLVDDWFQDRNLDLYNATFDAAIAFARKFPDTRWCYGNHDISYVWEALQSGYSFYARETVVRRFMELKEVLAEGNSAFIFLLDRVLFSHAGLSRSFVIEHFENEPGIEEIVEGINAMGREELWMDDSPIWARPQYGGMRMYPPGMMQVVGHTPVRATEYKDSILSMDNFSTYNDGSPIGDQMFVIVDTCKAEYRTIPH